MIIRSVHNNPGHEALLTTVTVKTDLQSTVAYSGKLSREKTFANFEVFWLYAKVLREILGVAFFGATKASTPRKFSPRKSHFAKVFSLESRFFFEM